MQTTPENRQQLSGSNEEERSLREEHTRQLVGELISSYGECFAEPSNRLAFIQSQNADDFSAIAQYVNARLRGEDPVDAQREGNAQAGFLRLLHTPSAKDKPEAFRRGYQAIQEYLTSTTDPVGIKIEGVAMAVEALIKWVHPYNDGNGRTGRFLGKFIEEGATDIDSLVAETAWEAKRRKVYTRVGIEETKESALRDADNVDILLDDHERDALREKAKTLPTDVEGMYLRVTLLLESQQARQSVVRYIKPTRGSTEV